MAAVATSGANAQLDPLGAALGVIAQPFPVLTAATATAPTSATIYGTAVYVPQGVAVTGVQLRNAVAAAGTLPTTARFGLADSTGKMLAISANANALATWVAGPVAVPFTPSAFVTTYSGVHFACFIVNGVWSVTQPTPMRGPGNGGFAAAYGAFPPLAFLWTGQTDLPAVNASLTITSTGGAYWIAVY